MKGFQHVSKIDTKCLPFLLLLLICMAIEVPDFSTEMAGVLVCSHLVRFEGHSVSILSV